MHERIIKNQLKKIQLPESDSHKGQNGKLLIIGGSDLFHAASKWSLDIASKFVDMVFYSSVKENNDLIREAKANFWNGIVVERENIEDYIQEADCILIGPGMTRTDDTSNLTNRLLQKYSDKKWVIDAGALQMINPDNLNSNMLITPHHQELEMLLEKIGKQWNRADNITNQVLPLTRRGTTIIVKGKLDYVFSGQKFVQIEGGNAGMTKGGTGDVLAGLVAALYTTHNPYTSAVVASYINKKAGDFLYQEVGPYFNASDLLEAIPQVMWEELEKLKN